MASPDTIILLIVDYHAAIGGKTHVPAPLRTPLRGCAPPVKGPSRSLELIDL